MSPDSIPAFLAGNSEMAGRMREYDWEATPLGHPHRWPQSLRSIVRLMLSAGHPMLVWWGPHHVHLYNDAHAPTLPAGRHPEALGQAGREGWPEGWEVIGPQITRVLNEGNAAWHDHQRIPVDLEGTEFVHWSYSLNPIEDADAPGGVGGVLLIYHETTAMAQARALRGTQMRLDERLRGLTNAPAILASAAELGGAELAADHAGFAEIDAAGRTGAVLAESTAPGAAAAHRPPRFSDAALARLRAGEVLAVEDCEADLRISPPDGATALAMGAAIAVPLRREGSLAAVLFAHCRTPRAWPEHEQRLLRDLGERSWAAAERLRAEAALRDANARLRGMLDARTADHDRLWQLSRDLLLTAGFDGVILSVNPAWAKTLGWTEAELVGRQLLELVHPDDLAATRSAGAGLLRQEPVARFENRYRHKDGSYRSITWAAVPSEGMVVAVGRDDTEICHQAALAEMAQARMRAIFETSYQYLGLLAKDGTLLDANPASLAGIRASLADVLGRKFWDTPWFAATPGMAEQVRLGVAEAAAGNSLRREISVHLPDGLRQFDFSLRPICQADGEVIAIVQEAVELTEWRATEEKLRQAQKMEAVGQLTGGLAHDFNNLLTGISGSLDMLKLRIAQQRTHEAERYINAAQTSASRAASLTHRLLAFSRRQTLDPHPTDANRLIAGMEDLIRRTIGPQISFETRLYQGLWPIFCDAHQLENAILNLCLNARDAMPDGGRLVIETDNVLFEPREARARDMQPGPYTGIFVTDTGIGMTAEVASRAFDPFFTTKPIGMGTGLGLSMIFGFTQQSGGQVRIHSAPGHGTTMRMFLPRHAPDAPAELPPAAKPAGAPRAPRSETVLVVDDEPTVRMLVTEVLDELGYSAIEAEDGKSGLSLLQSAARIDLLITDVGLPGGLNGRQMADAARLQRPDLKVMFITGYAETAVIGNGSLEPGMEVVTKPFTLEALAKRIKTMMPD